MNKHESAIISYSATSSLDARSQLFEAMQGYPGSPEEKERSLGLFLRGSLLARILAIGELYREVVNKPGMVLDIGTWRGQTAVLCENYRAIYEPLHFNRRILCLDTFEGYLGFGDEDRATALHHDGTYNVGGLSYAQLLSDLLELHEKNNAMGHNHGKHKVIAGDVRETLPRFFEENPNEFIALAFFDLNCLEPTEKCFEIVSSRLVPGGVVAFWQLTRNVVPAEGKFYAESIISKFPHEIHRSSLYPGLCYIKKV
jgi:hypothetical protein